MVTHKRGPVRAHIKSFNGVHKRGVPLLCGPYSVTLEGSQWYAKWGPNGDIHVHCRSLCKLNEGYLYPFLLPAMQRASSPFGHVSLNCC